MAVSKEGDKLEIETLVEIPTADEFAPWDKLAIFGCQNFYTWGLSPSWGRKPACQTRSES